MSVENRTTCSGIARYCQYCGQRLPERGSGGRECPERQEGQKDKAKYGSVSGKIGGL